MAKARKLYDYFVFDGTNQSELEEFWGALYAVDEQTFSVDESGALVVDAEWMPAKVIPVGGVFLPRTLEVYPSLADFQADYEVL